MRPLVTLLAVRSCAVQVQTSGWVANGLADLLLLDKAEGAMAVPNPSDPDLAFSAAAADLGQGWKVRPFMKAGAGRTVTLMDVDGPGIIRHIWMAPAPRRSIMSGTTP